MAFEEKCSDADEKKTAEALMVRGGALNQSTGAGVLCVLASEV